MFSYGTLTPATFQTVGSTPTPTTVYKMYACYRNSTTSSSLYTSIDGGLTWQNDTGSSGTSTDFAYLGGTDIFLYRDDVNKLYMLGKGDGTNYTGNCTPSVQRESWARTRKTYNSSVAGFTVFYNGSQYWGQDEANVYDSSSYSSTPFSGNGRWYTDNYFGLSIYYAYGENDGCFRDICLNKDDKRYALKKFGYRYYSSYPIQIRIYLCQLLNHTTTKDYTSALLGTTSATTSTHKQLSFEYLPGVGFLSFYNNSSQLKSRTLFTSGYTPTTYVGGSEVVLGGSDYLIKSNGGRSFYCPWTQELFIVPNANIVLWTSDGVNWNSSNTTGAGSGTGCCQFLTDGTNMVIATNATTYYHSQDKGQTWTQRTLANNTFNTGRYDSTIVVPINPQS